MDFYDLYLHPEGNLEEIADTAEMFGFSGIGIVKEAGSGKDVESFAESVRKRNEKRDIDLVPGCVLEVDSSKDLRKSLDTVREKIELVMVKGGDFDVNKAAARDSRIDLLINPQHKRRDAGMDHKTTKMATDHDVSIAFSLHSLLQTYGKVRSHVISHIRKNVELCQKYDTDIVVTSGARDKFDIRDPRELASLPDILGMKQSGSLETVTSMPSRIVEENRGKIKGKIKKKGVEEVE